MKLAPSPFTADEERVLAYLRYGACVKQSVLLADLGPASVAVQGLWREGFLEEVNGWWRLAP